MKKSAAAIVSTIMLGTAFTAQADDIRFGDYPSQYDGDGSLTYAPETMVREKCITGGEEIFIPGDKPGQPKILLCQTGRLVELARNTACASIDHHIGINQRALATGFKLLPKSDPEQALREYLAAKEMYCPQFIF